MISAESIRQSLNVARVDTRISYTDLIFIYFVNGAYACIGIVTLNTAFFFFPFLSFVFTGLIPRGIVIFNSF